MESKAEQAMEVNSFWEESPTGDPLWEEWVLGQEVLDWLDTPGPMQVRSELWVLVPKVISDQNKALLHKIAASIGYAAQDLQIQAVDSPESRPCGDTAEGQEFVNRPVLFLGVGMPTIPAGSNPQWANAPDLDTLGADESARKLLWAQIKGWRNEQ